MKRIQRVRGVKLPPNTKCCTRAAQTGGYANPYRIKRHITGYYYVFVVEPTLLQSEILLSTERVYWQKIDAQMAAVQCFKQWIEMLPPEVLDAYLGPLRRYSHLACWCALDEPCHVDVLIEKIKTVSLHNPAMCLGMASTLL